MTVPADVLIVDDNTELRDALGMLLQSEGHHVVEAANGQLALDALATGANVDVIILDLMMPVMDGATFLARKARTIHADVPVMIFSSAPTSAVAGLAGVVEVVVKLEGIDGLLAAVRRAAATGLCTTRGAFHV